MKVVLFAGGIGTRMWPVSRVATPKQFNPVLKNKSTVELMAENFKGLVDDEKMYVATNAEYAEIVDTKLDCVDSNRIFRETAMRDLGPSVGHAMSILAMDDPDEPVAIIWSDDLIKDKKSFQGVLKLAAEYLLEHPNQLVYIGHKPQFADQNKGWIHFGKAIKHYNGTSMYEFKDWNYRPPLRLAEEYFRDGEHAVNTGYFVTTPGFVMELYKEFAPGMYKQLQEMTGTWGTDAYQKTMEELYPKLDKISFDDLIVEKTSPDDAVVMVTDFGWYGFGDWQSIKEALQTSPNDNVIKGNVHAVDSKNCLIYNYTDQLVTPIGLEGMNVVVTPDAIMICPHEAIPEVKKMLKSFTGTELEKYT